ncbi:MAG: sensor histidine kinase [Christensenellales bacterium]|jgi:two-component system sensor histidine kinase YesM
MAFLNHKTELRSQLKTLMLIYATAMILIVSLFLYGSLLSAYSCAKMASETMVRQIAKNVELSVQSMKNAMFSFVYNDYVQKALTVQSLSDDLELHEVVTTLMDTIKSTNSGIVSIFLFNQNDRIVSDTSAVDHAVWLNIESLYDFRSDSFINATYSSVVTGMSKAFYYYAYISPVFSVSDVSEQRKKIGSCIFILDTRELQAQVQVSGSTENTLSLVLDKDNYIIANNNALKAGTVYQPDDLNLMELYQSGQIITYDGRYSFLYYDEFKETGWKIVNLVPVLELVKDIIPISLQCIGLTACLLLFNIFYGSWIIKSVTRQISAVVNFLSSGEKTLPDRQMDDSEFSNEFSFIAQSINTAMSNVAGMTSEMIEKKDALHKADLAEQEAVLLALQNQINPHFLYNTLNCISAIGMARGVTEVSEVASAMANIFRYAIKEDHMVTLSAEIKNIYEYMHIMNIRFEERFVLSCDLSQSMLERSMPKMILQPLVENAIQHGFKHKKGTGKIRIYAKNVDGESWTIVVKDNGDGLRANDLQELQATLENCINDSLHKGGERSIGLVNIHSRIRLQYGKPYGLDIESSEMVGTNVSVILPMLTYKRNCPPPKP